MPYVHPSENGNRSDVQWCQFKEPTEHSVDGKALTLMICTQNYKDIQKLLLDNTVASVAATSSSNTLPRNHYTAKDNIITNDMMKENSTLVPQYTFDFSAQRYTTEDLALSTHSSTLELFPRPFIAVNVDPYMMGVGGDDGWTASVHGEYLLSPGIYTFDLNLALYYS